MTAPRRPRSAGLLVGSTPGTLAKLHSAGQRLSRFFAKLRWRRLRAALRAASSSSARSSSWSGPTRSSRRLRSASPRNSPQAANSRSATRSPAAPNCFWAPSPSLWAVRSRTRCARAELPPFRIEVVERPTSGPRRRRRRSPRRAVPGPRGGDDPRRCESASCPLRTPLKRAPLPGAAPAALLDVERRGGADVAEQVLVGLVEGQGGALQDRLDRACGEVRSEELSDELDRVAARDAVPDREGDDRRLEAL